MYAFRFDSSDEVTITCRAFVCSISDLNPNCTQVNKIVHIQLQLKKRSLNVPQSVCPSGIIIKMFVHLV